MSNSCANPNNLHYNLLPILDNRVSDTPRIFIRNKSINFQISTPLINYTRVYKTPGRIPALLTPQIYNSISPMKTRNLPCQQSQYPVQIPDLPYCIQPQFENCFNSNDMNISLVNGFGMDNHNPKDKNTKEDFKRVTDNNIETIISTNHSTPIASSRIKENSNISPIVNDSTGDDSDYQYYNESSSTFSDITCGDIMSETIQANIQDENLSISSNYLKFLSPSLDKSMKEAMIDIQVSMELAPNSQISEKKLDQRPYSSSIRLSQIDNVPLDSRTDNEDINYVKFDNHSIQIDDTSTPNEVNWDEYNFNSDIFEISCPSCFNCIIPWGKVAYDSDDEAFVTGVLHIATETTPLLLDSSN
ncbi:uncharacterized protein CMU_021820 [Cryptosporidium muris RN66]|uniref:Uncharacterized protein n=1 Tax=Cryptosporidium muris (strain RN66) TaxID=441375 RepID=B6AJM7_CRYMR|nr:uncharacterized protein CMU_021820 [Cryptosporidium muris RN66]EEA08418.1 hypothetical protein CMU_021820 [Cryptosporidium muris RN66]|eukprot:XP_002142767.1 hypothetical protein [Cryptosporidium muris RN66]